MSLLRRLLLIPFLAFPLAIAGCEVDVQEGPLEEAGEGIDEGLDEGVDGDVEIED